MTIMNWLPDLESIARQLTIGISHLVEASAAVIIGLAMGKLLWHYTKIRHQRNSDNDKERIRVGFGTSVAVALELLLGADVLSTAVAPSWNDIGQLAAIAIIRTVLNFFLERELRQVREP